MPTLPITLEERRKRMGEIFRAARTAQRLSLIEVAVRAGVALRAVEAIERGGNPTLGSLLCVAAVVGVQVDVSAVDMEATP